jgi:hypothetical protein
MSAQEKAEYEILMAWIAKHPGGDVSLGYFQLEF